MHSNSLYIASLEPEAGKLVVTMGIMEILSRTMGKVAFPGRSSTPTRTRTRTLP